MEINFIQDDRICESFQNVHKTFETGDLQY